MGINTQTIIGEIRSAAAVAPMAGFTDSAFRDMCREHGAGITISEMISAKAVRMGDRKSLELMYHSDDEHPFGIQLFGTDPEDFRYSARKAEELFSPDFIDINMGCPAPKITGPGAGSRLMTTPALAAQIVSAVAESVTVPVSAKIRAGYTEVSAPELAPLLEKAGASFISVHGRTRDQMYRPPVDLEVIKRVKEAVNIPVIGNGDISSVEDARRMLEETGCDGVMIGRGALGNPFLFGAVRALISGEEIPAEATLEQKLEALVRQAEAAVSIKGEYVAIREMRKHTPYYLKGVSGAAALRARAVEICTLEDIKDLCSAALEAGPARDSKYR